jgi:hypothetical protein
MPNPFAEPGFNYTMLFFQKEWNDQRSFRSDHKDKEQERRNDLIKLYEHWLAVDSLR